MIIEPENIGHWILTYDNPYWGCVTDSETKEGATEILKNTVDGVVYPLIDVKDSPNPANSITESKWYGFAADTYENLMTEIEARGLL